MHLFTLRTLLNAIIRCLQLNTNGELGMTTWRWIISHRRCWITVYVFCRNAHMNIIVIIMSYICIAMRSIFCQLPSCNLFTQHATYLYGETPLVNLWTPVHSFTLIIQSTVFPALSTATIVLFYFTANKHHFPHYTFNPLFSTRPVRLTTALYRWGKVFWLCCVQVPHCCWHR